MARNIRLTLAYDGSNYAGWQVQPGHPSVQAQLKKAIHALTGETVDILSAGRTDAGVHALGQVANFVTESTIPPAKWRPALQTKLPFDIVIRSSDEAPLGFHATYAAKSKRYRYVIFNSRIDDPFLRRYVWRIGGDLNADAMRDAAQSLIGTHDFRSFETNWPNTSTSVRTMTEVQIYRTAGWAPWATASAVNEACAGESSFLCFEIVGDGFLYNMVRAIVGTLVNVARDTWSKTRFCEAFAALDRNQAGETAPAQGLYLVSVDYGETRHP